MQLASDVVTGTEMSSTFKIQAKVSKFVTTLQQGEMTVLKHHLGKIYVDYIPKRYSV
jgi:hypothetical protein